MSVRFNAPPGWPVPSSSWAPGDDWMPDPSWPTPPRGWTFWIVDQRPRPTAGETGTPRFGTPPRSTAATSAGYGTDRGSWLASLRARAADESLVAATSSSPALTSESEPVRQRVVPDSSWELDGLLASAGRLDI